MSVITFWNLKKQETGKTMSLTAIATYMAIEHNVKTLVISTTNKKDKMVFLSENNNHRKESII